MEGRSIRHFLLNELTTADLIAIFSRFAVWRVHYFVRNNFVAQSAYFLRG